MSDTYDDSELFTILREYAAIVPVSRIRFPYSSSKDTLHDFLLQSIILNPHFQKYPPSKQYQKSFWKCVVQHLELDVEIDTRILSILTETFTSTSLRGISVPLPPSPSYVTYYWRLDAPLPSNKTPASLECFRTTLLESGSMIESGTTGLRTWLASLHLADYIISNPEWVRDTRVLELGSGIGFLGMIIGSVQILVDSPTDIPPGDALRPKLHLTDVDSEVIARCISNIRLPCNMTASIRHRQNISVSVLDWSDALRPDISAFKAKIQQDINADLIIGADIVFDPSLIPALMATLSLALDAGSESRSKVALIALTVRNEATYATFRATAQKYNLAIFDIENPTTGSLFLNSVDRGAEQKDDVKIMKITVQ
ncbi:uncharacterized protein EV420DRAFT_1760162 [Desarmillaria tabescens]|uniref:FAM86 N-terminal domain-containing protein n=1 Tax=Armillaria tabescens TaxID=1929756 RepID=A0AA39TNW8_ARMTA|nr:uncharacterized protein EV420DRAFT_1760162 [Desarmillaria tabescens]KAK0465492.1 hypothetical protein EV420DRAFT_1760162 [Desarmillaria tabescens]